MSKIGDWVLEMQEAALEMTQIEFCRKFGTQNNFIWEYMNESLT